jgi:hypothetical protein
LAEFDFCGEFEKRDDSSSPSEIEYFIEFKYRCESVGASDPVPLSEAERDLEVENWTEFLSKVDKLMRSDSLTTDEIETK